MKCLSLDILYEKLDFKNGRLYPVMNAPVFSQKEIDWLEKGEWLAAAKRAGAEKIFFVENNPVAVFAECGAGLEEKVRAFNRIWCLARPRLLFLASPGEITVYKEQGDRRLPVLNAYTFLYFYTFEKNRCFGVLG